MDEKINLKSFTLWQRISRLFILAWFLWKFRFEIGWLIWSPVNFYFLQIPFPSEFQKSLGILTLWILFIAFIYIFYIFWFVQFVLPVTKFQDRFKAFGRFLTHAVSRGKEHGPALFVRNGIQNATIEELEKPKPGVAFLDMRSAITLDKQLNDDENDEGGKLKRVKFLSFKRTKPINIRVAGPGLVFTEKKERISGAVDLRTQSRNRKEVFADTRDGIRVGTMVFANFTIGQPPDILDVCLGGSRMDQVFVIEWEENQPSGMKKVKGLSPELDPDDDAEIVKFIHTYPNPSSAAPSDVAEKKYPFTFDAKRIEQSIYTETHLYSAQKTETSKKWHEWPTDVTAEIFRTLLAQQPFLNLYAPKENNPENYLMASFRKELSKKVRNTGVLAYRVVIRKNRQPIQIGQSFTQQELVYYPAHNLNRPAVLRDRGIKITAAGFTELKPKNNEVMSMFRQAWESSKEKEVNVKVADQDLEVARIKNKARMRAQQGMIYHFSKILENREYPREALAMLIYQELESAAANPETRRLLPGETLNMLSGIRTMLIPGEKSDEGPNNEYLDGMEEE